MYILDKLNDSLAEAFEEKWAKGEIPGWENVVTDDYYEGKLYCDACKKQFAKETVYQSHLAGKKHIKAAEQMKLGIEKPKKESNDYFQKCKEVANREFKISKYMQVFGQLREDTKSNVERKQARTVEEREEDVEFEVEGDNEPENENEEDDGKIYNPLKLPLDWDGKPIPYWLWKLHGLGVEYPCEICGNYIYMGRRAFDRHFQEWRHSHGMRCLGIPNMKQFYGITSIADTFACIIIFIFSVG